MRYMALIYALNVLKYQKRRPWLRDCSVNFLDLQIALGASYAGKILREYKNKIRGCSDFGLVVNVDARSVHHSCPTSGINRIEL